MLDSYLFIPGDKQKYLNKIDSVKADFIVIDLEDAVAFQAKDDAFNLVMSVKIKVNHFVRIPFFENRYSSEQIIKLIEYFEGRIAIPKLSNVHELIRIKNLVPHIDLNMIILVENPNCLLNINEIFQSFSPQIHAVGFGSHDFCSITGIKHEPQHILHYIKQLILYAKAYELNYIDGVDLNLKNFNQFKKECILAFEMGASGKFLIHPKQIEEIKNVQYLSEMELKEIVNVYEIIKDVPENSIEVYTINGKVYEKPHINRIKSLMFKLKNHGSKQNG